MSKQKVNKIPQKPQRPASPNPVTNRPVGQVEIQQNDLPKEFKFFDNFKWDVSGEWAFLKLFFGTGPSAIPVFHGAMASSDVALNSVRAVNMLEKLGARATAVSAKSHFEAPASHSAPTTFHLLNFIVRGEGGEMLIGQFSHRQINDFWKTNKSGGKFAATVAGAYSSEVDVQVHLIRDLIEIGKRFKPVPKQ